ncbi:MAG: hypothetical protein R3286_19625, partial [Gammaproteobacteria bacterium]|nr:hypothetical protein [Gammaproteobacteria bacterium]
DCYARLAPALDTHPFARVEDVGLLSRESEHDRPWLAARLGLDPTRRWCLVYVGADGIRGIDWRRLAAFRDWEFLGLYPLPGAPGNYHRITMAPDFGYADLTAASDVVLGKLGYGLVSECLHLARPVVFPPRALFREHALLADAVVSRGLGRELSLADLCALDIGAALEWAVTVRVTPLPAPAGDRIVALIDRARRR